MPYKPDTLKSRDLNSAPRTHVKVRTDCTELSFVFYTDMFCSHIYIHPPTIIIVFKRKTKDSRAKAYCFLKLVNKSINGCHT